MPGSARCSRASTSRESSGKPKRRRRPAMSGEVIAVHGPVVDVEFKAAQKLPKIYEVLKSYTHAGVEITLEVMEHIGMNAVRCIALSSTIDMYRGAPAEVTGDFIQVPVGEKTFGRLMNVLGQPIDGGGPIEADVHRPVRKMGKRGIKIGRASCRGRG